MGQRTEWGWLPKEHQCAKGICSLGIHLWSTAPQEHQHLLQHLCMETEVQEVFGIVLLTKTRSPEQWESSSVGLCCYVGSQLGVDTEVPTALSQGTLQCLLRGESQPGLLGNPRGTRVLGKR